MLSNWLRRFVVSARCFLMVFTCWVMMTNSVLAAEEEDPGKSWVACYFLLGLCICLGLIAVLRPVSRTTEVKMTKEDG